jgi:hypothetical protein
MARGIRVTFYADRPDMTALFEQFCYLGKFTYTPLYWDEGQPPPTVENPADIPNYGVLGLRTNSLCSLSYLVVDATDELRPTRFILTSGGARFSIDHGTNPSSVRLCLGGDAGDRTLIASQVETLGLTERAKQMQAAFSRVVRKSGVKVGSNVVLSGAMSKLREGWRLTHGKSYSPSLDLKLPQ